MIFRSVEFINLKKSRINPGKETLMICIYTRYVLVNLTRYGRPI